ncbi:IntraMembrane Protease (IMPAS) family [Caenorhabditis elegans]|uniref:IntraMembrane Protease (IMPAS) family n=1 Tax=Caenorhabditis elegans TaxID=6239 RepID=Q93346_CAEEL|nr:IntraMembrane Protease (IMPAS) family [Caenorhabditis elegans]CAB02277.1 IntraMembrane Protease (IMPAS) family [Caenorhabditis elegans]|eukprot:NP_001021023.1 IntraMembrane Protease (IMPAS) family [Caenorhabditis elegans]
MTIPIPISILILLLVFIPTTTTIDLTSISSPRGPFRTSYVFMTLYNKRTGERSKSCVNYQQYLRTDTSSNIVAYDFESAHPFNLKFWEAMYNRTNICPLPSDKADKIYYYNQVIPLDYRIKDDGTPCSKRFSKSQTAFRNASQFTVDVLKDHRAGASLLVLDKGAKFVQGWKDYLFSDFYDPYINSETAIPTFYIYRSVLEEKIMKFAPHNDISDDQVEIRFHRPSGGPFDASFAIIWMISMTCVAGGGIWAFNRHRAGKDVTLASQSVDDDTSSPSNDSETKGFLDRFGGIITICLMMTTLCGVLLLGYFFRPVLVIFFNIFLVIFGTCSLYGCIRGFLSNFKFVGHRWYNAKMEWFPTCGGRIHQYKYSEAFIGIICLSFCVTWFIIRRQPYAFILLDVINMALCMHVLKCLRLPSLKWISILMLCMFVYDAFMVFGTPYMTTNGCSVMLEVATGLSCAAKGKNKGYPVPPIEQESVPEKFPMLMQVAHFNPMNECLDMEIELGFQFTILGLGDIVMPGYLVAHCFTMNGFSERVRLIYGFISVVGYGIGLIVTFLALALMKTAQPALIYLVPSTLFPIIMLALCRGEFLKIWNGVPVECSPLVSDRNDLQGKKWINSSSSPDDTMEDIESNAVIDQSNSSSQQNPPVNV